MIKLENADKSLICTLINRGLSALIQRTYQRHISAIIFLLAAIFLSTPTIAKGATEFVSVVDTDGTSGDYSTLSSWEQYNQCNLLTSRVLSHGGITETIADDSYVKGATSGAYGTVVHVTSTQIAIETITGTFQNNEQIDKTDTLDGAISSPAANVTSSSAPDSIISVASCQATTSVADQTAVEIEGWTTSDTNYIKVYTTTANRHDGKWNTGKYRLEANPTYALIDIKELFVRFDGLQFKHTGTSGNYKNCIYIDHDLSDDFRISNSILWVNTSGTAYCLEGDGAGEVNRVWNCVLRGSNSPSGGIRMYNGTWYVYNCTISGFDNGLVARIGAETIKNCAVFNNTDDFSETFTTIDYCASDDGDGTNAVDWTSESTDWANVFVDYANGDFHLNNFTGTGAIMDQGDDLTAEGYTDDIDSETRSNHSWDIGADEAAEKIYRSVGPSKSTFLDDDDSHTDTIAITSGTATFAGTTIADNVGVGDVILYDSNDSGTLTSDDSIAFIKSRTDNQNYVIQTETGATPSDMSTPSDTWEIYRAYTSLSNAEAGTENTSIPISFTGGDRNLVTNNEQWNIACYANGTTADEAAVIIQDWTTGANNYIKVYTPTETTEVGTTQRHGGVWDEGKYRLAPTSGSRMIWNNQDYTEIEGLQVLSRDVAWNEGIRNENTGTKVSYCLIIGQANSYIGIDNQGSGSNYIWNNIVYNFDDTVNTGVGIHGGGGGPVYVYNNTVVNCSNGLSTSYDNTLAKNNLVYGCADSYYDSFKSGSDYNSTERDEDMEIVGGGGANNRKNQTFTFVDENASPPDYHLASNDAGAKDYGTDLSSDANLSFSDDIDGDSRPGDVGDWDIGADEVMPPTIIKTSLTSKINSSQTSKMTDGLVLMQSFDGNHMDWLQPTAEARDQSGQANHGDVIGATVAIGKIGQGLDFNGISGYVSQGNVPGGIQTIAFWIKADDLTDRKIIDIDGIDQIEIDGTGNILATSFPGATIIYIDGAVSSALTAGWHHIVITDTTGVSASAMDIGRVSAGYFDGELDEIRLYTRVLSSDEVRDLYRMGRVKFKK